MVVVAAGQISPHRFYIQGRLTGLFASFHVGNADSNSAGDAIFQGGFRFSFLPLCPCFVCGKGRN